MREIRVQIEAVDDEGRGRATFVSNDGIEFDVAARGAFLADDVLVQVERVFSTRRLLTGKVIKYFSQGECHVPRTCKHDEPCPACPLHGADSSLALSVKRARIERSLMDAGLDFEVDDVLMHDEEFGYRQKVKLMAQVVTKQLRLGVYVPYSHDFVAAEKCPYVNEKINSTIEAVLKSLNEANSEIQELEHIKAMILRAGKHGVSAILVTKKLLSDKLVKCLEACVERGELQSFRERLQSAPTNSILSGRTVRGFGPELIEPLEDGPLVDPDSFCQSDPVQATRMYDLVADFLVAQSDPSIGIYVDAYAGVGGFTRALLRRGVSQIVAIEQSDNALIALEKLGVEIILSPMGKALCSLGQRSIEAIVVDPPKKGLMEDASAIASLKAKRVALVSCDPDSMARDLQIFLSYGYLVERILPIDFFGGTPAIETVVFMRCH